MKKCVVTGGNGFIGSHMCRYLSERGYDVLIIDNHSSSPKHHVHSFGKFHNIDIADPKVITILEAYKPDYLFHFAAFASVAKSEREPLLYFKENVIKTITFINNCISANIKNIIFSSTCATFGIPNHKIIDESHSQLPINTYGKTKLIIERVLRDLSEKKLINAIVLRYFNAAGSSEDSLIGEHNLNGDRIIPNLCKALGSNEAFTIFGDQYPTDDGTCIRDYIHVLDLAEAHFKAAKYLDQNPGFSDFNLGSEKGFSVREVLDVFQAVAKTNLKINIGSPREGDPSELVANSQKAKKSLDYAPKYQLKDCIQHALSFYQKTFT